MFKYIWDSKYPTSKICLKMHWTYILYLGINIEQIHPFSINFAVGITWFHNTFIVSSSFIISVLVMKFNRKNISINTILVWNNNPYQYKSWTFELVLDSSITIICYYSKTVSSLAWLLLYHNKTIWVKTQRGMDKLL